MSSDTHMKFLKLANRYLAAHSHTDVRPTIRWYKEHFWVWKEPPGKWECYGAAVMDGLVHQWMLRESIHSDFEVARKVAKCVQSIILLSSCGDPPCWAPPVGPSLGDEWIFTPNWMLNPRRLAEGRDDYLREKSSRWFGTVALPYDYDPEARCPLSLRVIDESTQGDPEAISCIREFFGYWNVPDTRHHAALFLVGEAGSGKSTILEMAKVMLGVGNCSFLPLNTFGRRFGLTGTIGKYLNVSDETGNISKEAEEGLKWYVSGQPMQVDQKYRDPVLLTPTARVVVAANRWPKFRDTSGGIWRRIYVVPLNHQVAYEDVDVGLWERIREEGPGLFNWAMGGLASLLQNGRFTRASAGEHEKRLVQDSSQTHKAFIEDQVVPKEGAFLSNVQLQSGYAQWCDNNGVNPDADLIDLQKTIVATWPGVERFRRRIGNQQTRGLRGAALLI